MPKRNWVAIAQLSDTYTRVAISLAKGEILACYERGFPHLFTEGDNEGPLCVPLSAIKEAAFKRARNNYPDDPFQQEFNSNFWLSDSVGDDRELEIPIAFEWECPGSSTEHPPPIPEEIMEQLVGQRAQAGMTVVYRGQQYMLYNIIFNWGELPQVGSTFEFEPQLDYLSLVEANFVALDK